MSVTTREARTACIPGKGKRIWEPLVGSRIAAAAKSRSQSSQHSESELRHAVHEAHRSAQERNAAEAARAQPLAHIIDLRRGVEYQQTHSKGPRWERDLPLPPPALSALAVLEAYKSQETRELPPSSEPPLPKRPRSSRRPTIEERIRPLVEMLRDLEEKETGLQFGGHAAELPTTSEVIERILRCRSHPDERWRCLGLRAGATRAMLRKRFLELTLRLHPDKCSLPNAGEAFMLVERSFRQLWECDHVAHSQESPQAS